MAPTAALTGQHASLGERMTTETNHVPFKEVCLTRLISICTASVSIVTDRVLRSACVCTCVADLVPTADHTLPTSTARSNGLRGDITCQFDLEADCCMFTPWSVVQYVVKSPADGLLV